MKEKANKMWNIMKKNRNASIAICVAILTVCTIGVSYSAFFTVKTNTNNQVLTTGTLQVTRGGTEPGDAITRESMIGLSDEEGLKQSGVGVIHIENTGNLDANYVLTFGYDMTNFLTKVTDTNAKLTPLDYVRVAVYEFADGVSTLISGPINITDLPVYKIQDDYRYNRYVLLFDTLGTTSNNVKNYQVRIWLSDKATAPTSDTYFYVNSEVIAEANNTKMAYNLNGRIVDSTGTAINGAAISIQNNSLVTTTSTTGTFSIPNLLPGIYNVDITYNSVLYQGNITIKEGDTVAINKIETFAGDPTFNLATMAYNYGTTINKIKQANNITSSSSDYVMSSGTYNLMSTYELTGGSAKDVNNIVITLGDSEITNMSTN